jgi:hypothetical protein
LLNESFASRMLGNGAGRNFLVLLVGYSLRKSPRGKAAGIIVQRAESPIIVLDDQARRCRGRLLISGDGAARRE